jgi:hypothetical protein
VLFSLPSFSCAVLHSQPHMPLPRAVDTSRAASRSDTAPPFSAIFDAEVARAALGQETNPCEIKALKLSQASGSTGMDR